jgi:hypothetical protein
MSWWKAAVIAFGVGLVLGLALGVRPPCPAPCPPAPVLPVRDDERDSIATARAIRQQLIDSLITNTPPRERNIRIARSLGRAAQLDSLLAAPR